MAATYRLKSYKADKVPTFTTTIEMQDKSFIVALEHMSHFDEEIKL